MSSAVLSANSYGKGRVRVLQLDRAADKHDVHESTVTVLLRGDGLDAAYTSPDNSRVIPTDTVKQTVYWLAKKHSLRCIEDFAVNVGKHFVDKYAWVHGVEVTITQDGWRRMPLPAGDSKHTFVRENNAGKRSAVVQYARGGGVQVTSRLSEYALMKTTASGFVDYNRCDLTVLQPSTDRMMATKVDAFWTYVPGAANVDYNAVFERIVGIMHEKFADHYSPSLQFTNFRIGQTVIDRIAEVQMIDLTTPNLHYWVYDLDRFGVKNGTDQARQILYPTDEPHGVIKATVSRRGARL